MAFPAWIFNQKKVLIKKRQEKGTYFQKYKRFALKEYKGTTKKTLAAYKYKVNGMIIIIQQIKDVKY